MCFLNQTEGAKEAIVKLSSFKERFDPVLSQFLAQEIQEARNLTPELAEFVEVAAEFILRDGKRLRPAFVFEGYKAVGGEDESAALYVGMSVELLHAAALVHDDIIDKSDLRRGKPTVHQLIAKKFGDENLGNSLAIIVGDTLLAMSNKVFSTTPFPEERAKIARVFFTQMCTEINYGQYLDILGNIREEIDWNWAMKVMEYKTARYTVEKPLLIGASLGGASSKVFEAMRGYAIPLGIAFQIQDDILGMFGDEARVGKPVDSDLKEGKKTLLILKTLEKLKSEGRVNETERLSAILGNPELAEEDYHWTQQIIIETGSLEYSRQLARSLITKAKSALGEVDIEKDSRNYLLGIADFMLEREY